MLSNEQLVEQKKEIVKRAAKKHASHFGKNRYKDFFQEGIIALIKTYNGYLKSSKPDKEKTLDSYLYIGIVNHLSKVALKLTSEVAVSVSTREKVIQVKKRKEEGWSEERIARELRITPERVVKLAEQDFTLNKFLLKTTYNHSYREFEILNSLDGIDKQLFQGVMNDKTITDLIQETGKTRNFIKNRLLDINRRIESDIL